MKITTNKKPYIDLLEVDIKLTGRELFALRDSLESRLIVLNQCLKEAKHDYTKQLYTQGISEIEHMLNQVKATIIKFQDSNSLKNKHL